MVQCTVASLLLLAITCHAANVVQLDAFADDSIRIRVAPAGNGITEPPLQALKDDGTPNCSTRITLAPNELTNGNMRVTYDPSTSFITATRVSDGKVLLQQTVLTFGEPNVPTTRAGSVSALVSFKGTEGEKIYGLGEHRTGVVNQMPYTKRFADSELFHSRFCLPACVRPVFFFPSTHPPPSPKHNAQQAKITASRTVRTSRSHGMHLAWGTGSCGTLLLTVTTASPKTKSLGSLLRTRCFRNPLCVCLHSSILLGSSARRQFVLTVTSSISVRAGDAAHAHPISMLTRAPYIDNATAIIATQVRKRDSWCGHVDYNHQRRI